jgi:hypothetical protein
MEGNQHRAAVGGDLRMTERLRAYARHEFISSFAGPYALNPRQERYATVVGLGSGESQAGNIFSEYRLRDAIDGRSAQAAIGLRNRWTPRDGLHLDAAAERVAPLRGGGITSNAAGVGIDYARDPRWRATARLDLRRSGQDDQALGSFGFDRKLGRDWGLLARGSAGILSRDQLHARSQLGIAWRETDRNRWNGLARYELRIDREPEGLGPERRRHVNLFSAHADRRVTSSVVLRGQAATRVTGDRAHGATARANASLFALRGTIDLDRRWDTGVVARTLMSDGFDRYQNGLGAEVGFLAARNLRLAAGFNLFGYADADLDGGSRSDRGLYLDVGFKFDEEALRFLESSAPSSAAKAEAGR